MRIFRVLSYPATSMLLLAGIYTLIQVAPSNRMRVFAMLAMTAVGATELIYAAAHALGRSLAPESGLVPLLVGTGAILVGFSLLDGIATIPFVIGSLLFGFGLLLRIRPQPRPA
jgi:hypothetical protein